MATKLLRLVNDKKKTGDVDVHIGPGGKKSLSNCPVKLKCFSLVFCSFKYNKDYACSIIGNPHKSQPTIH